MEKNEDLKIQELLDLAIKDFKDVMADVSTQDLKAYKELYGQLGKPPVQRLSLSFKSNVMGKIEIVKKQDGDIKFYLLSGIIIAMGIFLIGVSLYNFSAELVPYFKVINRFKEFIFIAILAILSFNQVEKRLQKSTYNP